MPEYLSPGVYVEEVDTGSKPIEGVSTSTTGMIGMAKKGPTTNEDGSQTLPVLITSFNDFRRKYGGYFDFGPLFKSHRYLPFAVEGFFQNGGKRIYIKRILPTGAVKATITTKGGMVTRLKSDIQVAHPKEPILVNLRGIDGSGTLTFTQIKKGITIGPESIAVSTYERNTNKVTLTASLVNIYEAKYTTVELNVPRPNSFDITASDEGFWGNNIDIKVYQESSTRSEYDSFISGGLDNNKIKLKSTSGFYVNAWVEIDTGGVKTFKQVKQIDGDVITLYGTAMTAADFTPIAGLSTIVSTCEFRLMVSYEDVSENFTGLTLENIPGKYYKDIINNGSELIRVSNPLGTDPSFFPSGDDGLHIVLAGGIDGTAVPTDDDYKGIDNGPGQRTGLTALIDRDEISTIAVPGITSQLVQDAMIVQ